MNILHSALLLAFTALLFAALEALALLWAAT